MPTSESPRLRRYRGVLLWIDMNGRRTRHGLINRAVLRQQGLTVEFTGPRSRGSGATICYLFYIILNFIIMR